MHNPRQDFPTSPSAFNLVFKIQSPYVKSQCYIIYYGVVYFHAYCSLSFRCQMENSTWSPECSCHSCCQEAGASVAITVTRATWWCQHFPELDSERKHKERLVSVNKQKLNTFQANNILIHLMIIKAWSSSKKQLKLPNSMMVISFTLF